MIEMSIIVEEDWLKINQADISFNPNVSTIKKVQVLLGWSATRIIAVYSQERY